MKTLTRSLLGLAILAALGLLAGCNTSSGNTPVGVPITISLSAAPFPNINQGGSSNITATVTGDTTNAGVSWSQSGPPGGTLTNVTTTSVTYTAPASVSGSSVGVSITATSKASSSVTSSIQLFIIGAGITLSANPSTINAGQGQTSTITATVTGESSTSVTWSNPALGTLSNETATTATYNPPASVSSATPVVITATSVVGNLVGTVTVTVNPAGTGSNVATLSVDGGPLGNYPNGVFTSTTICQPSTTNCATVDHLLVDTGSFGLRVLQTALNGLTLNPITSGGFTLNDCVLFGDGSFLWGEVAPADVSISGEKAGNIPVHVVADPPGGAGQIPSGCSGNGGIDEDTQAILGANGILGVGPEPTDCIYAGADYCDGSQGTPAPVYYACSGNPLSCTVAQTQAADQVTNPVVAFATDNNGTVMNFPAVPPQPQTTGTITFGIGTQSNNALGTATVYTATASANNGWVFSTTYSGLGLYLPFSFIDAAPAQTTCRTPAAT